MVQPDSTPSPVAESTVQFAVGDQRPLGAGLVCSGSSSEAAPAALVINTVISATDCNASKPSLVADAAAESRLLRFELQRVAQALLPFEHRARVCLRCRIPTEEVIKAGRTLKGSGRLVGIMMCALPWLCPVCAAVISERRRDELRQLLAWWRDQGRQVFFSTFTRSHTKDLPLKACWEGLTAAYVWVTKHRDYRELCAAYGVDGRIWTVKATEVTWGAYAGWHPHLHVAQGVAGDADRQAFDDGLWSLWMAAADRFEFGVTRENGLRVQKTFNELEAYLAKWGGIEPQGRPWEVQDELTKANTKRGRGGHYSPFDLLRLVAEKHVAWPAELFREFAAASYRQHQLQWSRGLKAAAGIKDLSDQKIAERPQDAFQVLALLSDGDWQAIRYYRQQGPLHELLRLGDAGAVKAFVTGFSWKYQVQRVKGGVRERS